MSPTHVRSATPASVWTPAEQKPSLGAAQGSLKSHREPAQQRPLRLEAPRSSAPSTRGTGCQCERRGPAGLHSDRREQAGSLDPSAGRRGGSGEPKGSACGVVPGQGRPRQDGGRGGCSQARNPGSPDRYRAASNCRSIQAGALGGRFHSRAAGGTAAGAVSLRIFTIPT